MKSRPPVDKELLNNVKKMYMEQIKEKIPSGVELTDTQTVNTALANVLGKVVNVKTKKKKLVVWFE